MSEQQPKLSQWFHNCLIYFLLWVYAAFGVAFGAREIWHAREDGLEYQALFILLGVLLIALGLYTVKVRFDLAAFRPGTPKRLLIVCCAAAALVLAKCLLLYVIAEDVPGSNLLTAGIFACWGISLYRYYGQREYLFR